tara:strand:+ start:860 stop:1063 length:204 start_codon:yes stop_codon:yes gene_type:complete
MDLFYNQTFFLISGSIIGNIIGITYYTIDILNNKREFKIENMIDAGYISSFYMLGLISIFYKIKKLF